MTNQHNDANASSQRARRSGYDIVWTLITIDRHGVHTGRSATRRSNGMPR